MEKTDPALYRALYNAIQFSKNNPHHISAHSLPSGKQPSCDRRKEIIHPLGYSVKGLFEKVFLFFKTHFFSARSSA